MNELLEYYKDLLIIQYRNKPKARLTVETYIREFLSIYNLLQNLNICFTLDHAYGEQLDIVAKYFGAVRNFVNVKFGYSYFAYQYANATALTTHISVDSFKTVSNGAFKAVLDGGDVITVSGLDFTACTTIAEIANVLTLGMRNAFVWYHCLVTPEDGICFISNSMGVGHSFEIAPPDSGVDITQPMYLNAPEIRYVNNLNDEGMTFGFVGNNSNGRTQTLIPEETFDYSLSDEQFRIFIKLRSIALHNDILTYEYIYRLMWNLLGNTVMVTIDPDMTITYYFNDENLIRVFSTYPDNLPAPAGVGIKVRSMSEFNVYFTMLVNKQNGGRGYTSMQHGFQSLGNKTQGKWKTLDSN